MGHKFLTTSFDGSMRKSLDGTLGLISWIDNSVKERVYAVVDLTVFTKTMFNQIKAAKPSVNDKEPKNLAGVVFRGSHAEITTYLRQTNKAAWTRPFPPVVQTLAATGRNWKRIAKIAVGSAAAAAAGTGLYHYIG